MVSLQNEIAGTTRRDYYCCYWCHTNTRINLQNISKRRRRWSEKMKEKNSENKNTFVFVHNTILSHCTLKKLKTTKKQQTKSAKKRCTVLCNRTKNKIKPERIDFYLWNDVCECFLLVLHLGHIHNDGKEQRSLIRHWAKENVARAQQKKRNNVEVEVEAKANTPVQILFCCVWFSLLLFFSHFVLLAVRYFVASYFECYGSM